MLVAEEIRGAESAPGISSVAQGREFPGDCPLCRNLESAYEARFTEYVEARASASYAVSKKVAAQKNVEMERARYELEEHRLDCAEYLAISRRLQPEKRGQLVA